MVNSLRGEIILQSTPILRFTLSENTVIEVKHPYLSELLHSTICEGCKQYGQCFEKVCAVRVHPDGMVTPCLNRMISFEGQTVHRRIEAAYKTIKRMVLVNDIYGF